jgi:hypothetical protein
MTNLLGQKVRLPDAERCRRCGHDIAWVIACSEAHLAPLACIRCGASCGTIGERTGSLIARIAGAFGAPEIIAIRRPKPVSGSRQKNPPVSPAQ